jgi:hypothetical protein
VKEYNTRKPRENRQTTDGKHYSRKYRKAQNRQEIKEPQNRGLTLNIKK